jgi:alpha-L-fucosidase
MKPFLVLALLTATHALGAVAANAAAEAQPPHAEETPQERDARMRWWRDAKFGLFIHWGVYSVLEGKYGDRDDYGEWIMYSNKIPMSEYKKLPAKFNPVKFDAQAWVKMAKDAGQKYIIITSKHHDGFAMYRSKASDYNIAEATPFGRDPIAELAAECEKEGIRLGFYYSQAQDWGHAGGAADPIEGGRWDPGQEGSFDDYLDRVAVPQVGELLSSFGQPPAVIWFDTPIDMTPERGAKFYPLLGQYPDLIVNNRLYRGFPGDFSTPENFVPVTGYPGDWESCMTMNKHWGYNAADQAWKSPTELIRKLVDTVAKGGNLLLNVGPTPQGEIPQASVDRLREMGRWLRTNGESVYGTRAGPFTFLTWGTATRKDNRLYLQVFEWPKDGKLRVPLKNAAKSAHLLTEPGTELKVTREPGRLVVDVPATAPDPASSVVVLELDSAPEIEPPPTFGAKATASAALTDSPAAKALDGTAEGRWRAPEEVKSAWLEVDLGRPCDIAGLGFDEPDVFPRMEQHYKLEVAEGNGWRKIAEGQTDGHGARRTIPAVTAQKFRITMDCAKGSPGIAEFQLYRAE